jgi:hypothetical protein
MKRHDEWIGLLERLKPPQRTESDAYAAGRDAARNGANTENCHFSNFATRELTQAWERGKADGSKEQTR